MTAQSQSLASVPKVPAQGSRSSPGSSHTRTELRRSSQTSPTFKMSPFPGAHRTSSFAVSVFVVAVLLAPALAAGGQMNDIATLVMIEDLTDQLILVSDISGGPVSTGTTGFYAIGCGGNAYSFSFTAGGINVTDTSTLSPDGIATGTGIWSHSSTIITTGTTLVSYDSSAQAYTAATDLTFPTLSRPGGPPPHNDIEAGMHWRNPIAGIIIDSQWYTMDGKTVGPPVTWATYCAFSRPGDDHSTVWSNTINDPVTLLQHGDVMGNQATGTFTGTFNAVPEPATLALLVIGIVSVALVGTLRSRPSPTRSARQSSAEKVSGTVELPRE
jgi:hypothetical protein